MSQPAVCRTFFSRGFCRFGNRCRFQHDLRQQPARRPIARHICLSFQRSGQCRRGDDCKFSHQAVYAPRPQRKHRDGPAPFVPSPGQSFVQVTRADFRTTESSVRINGVCLPSHRGTSLSELKCDVDIDGCMLEGGGQVVRNSMAYASLTQKTIRISNIRGKRPKPGLAAQHLAGVVSCMVLTGEAAQLKGGFVGSRHLYFSPGKGLPTDTTSLAVDIGTAGAIALLCQVNFPRLLFSQQCIPLTMLGGTNATMAPALDYIEHVLLPTLKAHQGIQASITIQRRGWFPRGGGLAVLNVTPVSQLPSFEILDRGTVVKFSGKVITSGRGFDKHAQEITYAMTSLLAETYPEIPFELIEVHDEKADNGICAQVLAHTTTGCILAGTAVGELNKRQPLVHAGFIGRDAVLDLFDEIRGQGCVDRYLQDQLVIFMALAHGTSRVRCGRLTLHTRTAMYIAERLTGARFSVLTHAGDRLENVYTDEFPMEAMADENRRRSRAHMANQTDAKLTSSTSSTKSSTVSTPAATQQQETTLTQPELPYFIIECEGAKFTRPVSHVSQEKVTEGAADAEMQ